MVWFDLVDYYPGGLLCCVVCLLICLVYVLLLCLALLVLFVVVLR